MAGNPLEDDPERERRVRDRAYHLWNDEGRPHGRHDEFWERARELVGMEESAGFGQLPNPERAGRDPAQREPVEEAFLQENLGEFPGRFADQGESEPTPHARHDDRSAAEAPKPMPARTKGRAASPAPETLPAKPSLKARAIEAAKDAKSAATHRKGKPKR